MMMPLVQFNALIHKTGMNNSGSHDLSMKQLNILVDGSFSGKVPNYKRIVNLIVIPVNLRVSGTKLYY